MSHVAYDPQWSRRVTSARAAGRRLHRAFPCSPCTMSSAHSTFWVHVKWPGGAQCPAGLMPTSGPFSCFLGILCSCLAVGGSHCLCFCLILLSIFSKELELGAGEQRNAVADMCRNLYSLTGRLRVGRGGKGDAPGPSAGQAVEGEHGRCPWWCPLLCGAAQVG